MGMDQYLLIPFLVGWTSIYQLFWCSPGVQGFDTLPYKNMLYYYCTNNPSEIRVVGFPAGICRYKVKKWGGGSTKSQTWVKSDSAFSSFSTKSKPSTPFLSVLFSLLYQLSGSTGSKPWVGCSQIDDLQRKLQGVCINSHIAWYCIGSLVRKLPSYGRWSWLGFTSSCQPHHHMLTPSSCPPHHHQAISWDT